MFAAPNFFQTGGGTPVYMSDVFSTTTYTGNTSTQTITNGINLSSKGGLVWTKSTTSSLDNALFDTARGLSSSLLSNQTIAAETYSDFTSWNSNGYSIGNASGRVNGGANYVSWTFRKEPKFFDIVTYTGNGNSLGQTISHNLQSTIGCIIVKRIDGSGSWFVYHRGNPNGANSILTLNSVNAESNVGVDLWSPTTTTFKVDGTYYNMNTNNALYVAYVFAHNSGGFGGYGTDNAISCGSYEGTGLAQTVNIGYQPQFVLIKRTDSGSLENWKIFDTSRDMTSSSTACKSLAPNLSINQVNETTSISTASNGFTLSSSADGSMNAASGTYVYIAIRANS